jgi:fatty acid desaturase
MTSTALQRAGTADRERTGRHLGVALSLGYLTLDEYEDRLARAMAANTYDTLHRLTADLPVDQLRRHDPQARARRAHAARLGVRIHLAAYLAMAVLVTGVWLTIALAAGAWYPWLIWPILGGGLGVLGHAVPVALHRRAQAA